MKKNILMLASLFGLMGIISCPSSTPVKPFSIPIPGAIKAGKVSPRRSPRQNSSLSPIKEVNEGRTPQGSPEVPAERLGQLDTPFTPIQEASPSVAPSPNILPQVATHQDNPYVIPEQYIQDIPRQGPAKNAAAHAASWPVYVQDEEGSLKTARDFVYGTHTQNSPAYGASPVGAAAHASLIKSSIEKDMANKKFETPVGHGVLIKSYSQNSSGMTDRSGISPENLPQPVIVYDEDSKIREENARAEYFERVELGILEEKLTNLKRRYIKSLRNPSESIQKSALKANKTPAQFIKDMFFQEYRSYLTPHEANLRAETFQALQKNGAARAWDEISNSPTPGCCAGGCVVQ